MGYFMIFMGYTINLMGYGLTSFWVEPRDGDGELKSTWDVQMGIELVLGKTCRYHGRESQLFVFLHTIFSIEYQQKTWALLVVTHQSFGPHAGVMQQCLVLKL